MRPPFRANNAPARGHLSPSPSLICSVDPEERQDDGPPPEVQAMHKGHSVSECVWVTVAPQHTQGWRPHLPPTPQVREMAQPLQDLSDRPHLGRRRLSHRSRARRHRGHSPAGTHPLSVDRRPSGRRNWPRRPQADQEVAPRTFSQPSRNPHGAKDTKTEANRRPALSPRRASSQTGAELRRAPLPNNL